MYKRQGINCADEAQAEQTAKTLCALFDLEYKPGNSSIFAGSAVECNKAPGRGAMGHIAIGTNNVDRAVYHLSLIHICGLPAAEVTFRTAAAEEAIRRIVAEVPDMLVGAGTVLTKEQADRAIAAGSQFIVSPGFNPRCV